MDFMSSMYVFKLVCVSEPSRWAQIMQFGCVVYCLMAPGLSKDIQGHVLPYFSKL